MPNMRIAPVVSTDNKTVIARSCEPPKRDHLNPSMMPTIGFKAYTNNHFLGIMLSVYATGEEYNHTWIRNGAA
jgi:hypothetical protein